MTHIYPITHSPKAAGHSRPDIRTPGSYGGGGGEEVGKLWPIWPFVYCPPAGNGLYIFKWMKKKPKEVSYFVRNEHYVKF